MSDQGRNDLMGELLTLRDALPDMLSTQLLAADVYSVFFSHARSDEESQLWRCLLSQELGHIRFVSMMMEEETLPTIHLPAVRIDPFRELCEKARKYAPDSAFERTLWGLRLEHAQIDFGVEALATHMVERAPDTPVYPGPLNEQYERLLSWAERYRGAREIAIQIARIEEHLTNRPTQELE